MYNENFESDRGKAMGFDFKKGFKGSGPFLAAGGTIGVPACQRGNGSLQQFSSLWEPDPDP